MERMDEEEESEITNMGPVVRMGTGHGGLVPLGIKKPDRREGAQIGQVVAVAT